MAIYIASMQEFVNLVKTNGPYDLKNNSNSLFSKKSIDKKGALYRGKVFKADDFGNYNFGVAAKAFGLSLSFSQIGAGLYQIKSGTSSWNYINSFFDDPRDSKMIKQGYFHF